MVAERRRCQVLHRQLVYEVFMYFKREAAGMLVQDIAKERDKMSRVCEELVARVCIRLSAFVRDGHYRCR